MIRSSFIYNILDLMFEDDEESVALRKQLPYIEECTNQYTGCGVFIKFKHFPGIEAFRYKDTNLDGPSVKCLSRGIDATTMIFTENGLIDRLEIWNRLGEYPSAELDEYTLIQEWQGSPGKQLTVAKQAPH